MTQQEYGDPHRLAAAAVVVGVDGSPGSNLALRWAAGYAAEHRRALHIVHGLNLVAASSVVGPYQVISPRVIDGVRAQGRAIVTRAEHTAHLLEPELRISVHMSADTATSLLLERSKTAFAVVLGATGQTGTVGHLGSTLLAVTSHAEGAVIVVRPDSDADETVHISGPVVVGVDGSAVSDAAIGAAFAEAAERGVELIAAHTWSDWTFGTFAGEASELSLDEMQNVEEIVLSERLAGWQEKYPEVHIGRRVYFSEPARHLQEWSKTAQLLVVGNRGRGGFLGLLLGSTAHTLVQHAHCPVMVVHPTR
ncbi:universal stress protein [Nocardia sp. NPDC006630]|uniref:universal stress protein n=1 Tax=Nocardia sp. NPDC006630 TaxID=3157181 RepID=UPI0033AD5C72